MATYEPRIDWSAFRGPPSQTCYCRCGGEFRSHAKTMLEAGMFVLVSKDPCPDCGKHNNLRQASSDPERWTVRE